jgi:hypothetical protein
VSSNPPPANTLLFIPDISGFTKFVDATEITHSQHIIQGLLEALLDAYKRDLKVSETECDRRADATSICFARRIQAPPGSMNGCSSERA